MSHTRTRTHTQHNSIVFNFLGDIVIDTSPWDTLSSLTVAVTTKTTWTIIFNNNNNNNNDVVSHERPVGFRAPGACHRRRRRRRIRYSRPGARRALWTYVCEYVTRVFR